MQYDQQYGWHCQDCYGALFDLSLVCQNCSHLSPPQAMTCSNCGKNMQSTLGSQATSSNTAGFTYDIEELGEPGTTPDDFFLPQPPITWSGYKSKVDIEEVIHWSRASMNTHRNKTRRWNKFWALCPDLFEIFQDYVKNFDAYDTSVVMRALAAWNVHPPNVPRCS